MIQFWFLSDLYITSSLKYFWYYNQRHIPFSISYTYVCMYVYMFACKWLFTIKSNDDEVLKLKKKKFHFFRAYLPLLSLFDTLEEKVELQKHKKKKTLTNGLLSLSTILSSETNHVCFIAVAGVSSLASLLAGWLAG